jgi:CBS domain containing-hemolysin-like protein
MMNTIYNLFLFIIPLLLLEGFFSGSEIALVAANHKKIRREAERGSKKARMALKVLRRPERFLATTLCGANLSEVTNVILTSALFYQLWGEKGDFYTILLLSPLILIFGEIIPKSIFQTHATSFATKVSYPIWVISYLFYPVIYLIEKVSLNLKRKGGKESPFITREELKMILKSSQRGSDLKAGEVTMIRRIFDFTKTRVKEGMVPLIEVKALSEENTVGDVISLIASQGHSRIPVYRERIDNIIGVVNSFDLFSTPNPDKKLGGLIRTCPYIPETKPIDELLLEFQRSGNHLAVVVDEYGGAVGIITIDDILEEIVGEIRDEYDTEEEMVVRLKDNQYLISGRMEIDHINELLHLNLPKGGYETLGGFLLELFGHIPSPGEKIQYQNLTFTVLRASDRVIREIKVKVEPIQEQG